MLHGVVHSASSLHDNLLRCRLCYGLTKAIAAKITHLSRTSLRVGEGNKHDRPLTSNTLYLWVDVEVQAALSTIMKQS